MISRVWGGPSQDIYKNVVAHSIENTDNQCMILTDTTQVVASIDGVTVNIWEAMETHMHLNLGTYGLTMLHRFLDLKEQAEDCNMCPEDTEERQQVFEDYNG